jgi:hypothetical protein
MEILKCIPFKFLLPLILLGVQFSLKFFIDRRATAYNFYVALLEVPISMFFISLSLLSAFIIAGGGDLQLAFIYVLLILVVLIFCLFFWRRSIENLDKKYFGRALGLGLLNLTIALPTIVFIIIFLIETKKQ